MSASDDRTIVTNVDDIPKGILLTRTGGEIALSPGWSDSFACIRADGKAYLLVGPSKYGTAAMFEVINRAKAAGVISPELIRVTDSLLKLLYQSNMDAPIKQEKNTTVEDLAAEIISAAHEQKASDIHIEARGQTARVFFRVNSIRRVYGDLTYDNARSLGVVLYSVHADAGSKEVSWNPEQVMDGALEWVTKKGSPVTLRFSSSPIYPNGGFQIVIRILSMEAKGLKIPDLGYADEQISMLDVMISGSAGMVILCGPTNSGKSTTMQALMDRIYQRRGDTIKMISVEDPVEYILPGVCQISIQRKRKTQMDEKSGSVFTTFLRGTLRQDPDVVMVGEIRDSDSASVVKDLVLAGRKLLATLHTYSAMWAYIRLREIGVPWEILTMPGFVSGIVYQRLVPVVCPDCSIPLASEEGIAKTNAAVLYRVQQVADLEKDNVRIRGDGCPRCKGTGYVGQTLCAEFVIPDRTLLGHLSSGNIIDAERYWRKAGVGSIDGNGGVSALAHGISKMRRGLLTPEDVENQIDLLTADIAMLDSMISNDELDMLSGKSSRR